MNTLYFKQMIEGWRRTQVEGSEREEFNGEKDLALDVMEKARVFVFDTHNFVNLKPSEDPLDLPFATCSIERIGAPMGLIPHGGQQHYVFCVAVHELAFNDYAFVIMTAQKLNPYDIHDYAHGPYEIGVVTKRNDKTYPGIKTLVADKLNSMNNSDNIVGGEKCKERIKLGTSKSKRVRVIKDIIHIVPKKLVKKYENSSITGRKLDWSQRWEVRGHWRELPNPKSVGKDREGHRGVLGWTWVNKFEKGAKDKPLVKKVRVIRGQ